MQEAVIIKIIRLNGHEKLETCLTTSFCREYTDSCQDKLKVHLTLQEPLKLQVSVMLKVPLMHQEPLKLQVSVMLEAPLMLRGG